MELKTNNTGEMIHLLIESILEPKGWPAGEGAGVLNFKLQRQELPTPKKILIIQLTSIGDVVMTTPVIEGLREKYPKAYIAFLLDEPSLDVVRGSPFLDEVILFDEYRYFREIKTRQKTTSEIEDHLTLDLGPPSKWYNYRCSSCNYETKIEDIVVDAYFYSQGCKEGMYPTFTCPKCNKRMKYVNDLKSAPKVR